MSRWKGSSRGKPDIFTSEIRLRDDTPARRVKVNKLLKLLRDGKNKEDIIENVS